MTEQPTMELRFRKQGNLVYPNTNITYRYILQQKFIAKEDTASGVLTNEVWRDVPLMEEN